MVWLSGAGFAVFARWTNITVAVGDISFPVTLSLPLQLDCPECPGAAHRVFLFSLPRT